MIKWKGIITHHSASHDVNWKEIDRWHKERGWDKIGYHYVIRKNGDVELGRPLTEFGIHAKERNDTHIGICVTGAFSGKPPNDKAHVYPTTAQIESTKELLILLAKRFSIPLKNIERHRETCPGAFPLEGVVQEIKDEFFKEALKEANVPIKKSWQKNIIEILKNNKETLQNLERNSLESLKDIQFIKERTETIINLLQNSEDE